jgi:TatD DNase family protein
MLLETDAPFLTPHPFRGRPNAPDLLGWTARGIAAAKGVEPGVVAAGTTATAARVFPVLSGFTNTRVDVDG